MEKDGEIPVFDEATENLIDAAMATAAARAGAGAAGYREAVENMVRAAMALPGLHFTPTDEELIRCYLQKKVKKEAMVPLADMREANVSLHNPMTLAATLPNLGDREWYFFTPRDRKYSRGIRPDRGTDGGFWKATGADKKVMSLDGTQTIGYKKSLVFNMGAHTKGAHVKTNWIMYEYRLNQPPRPKQSENDMRLDDWVLCSIHDQPHQAQRVAVKRNRPAEAVHHVEVDVQEQYAQQPSSTSNVDIIQYLEQQLLINNDASISTSCSAEAGQCQQQLEKLLLTPPDSSIPQLAGVGFDSFNWEELYKISELVEDNYMSSNQGHLELQPSTSTSHHVEAEQYLEQQPLPVTLNVPAVMEQEQYRYLEQQPSTGTSHHVEAEQYLEQEPLPTLHVPAVMEQEQYRYLELEQQQQPLPSLDVAEQEQYAYHDLPTTLGHVPVFMEKEQYAQQYRRYQQEYQYVEQQSLMPLINNNNASASAEAEQYEQDLEKMLTPDNSIPQAAGVDECEWIKDFFDFTEPIDDIYMTSSNQGQGTTSIPSAVYDEAEAASAPFKPLPTPTTTSFH